MRDLKYLAAYLVPALALCGLLVGEWTSWVTVFFVFGLVPLLDPILGGSEQNLDEQSRTALLNKRIFDWLLYLNLPIVFGTVGLFLYLLNTRNWTTWEYAGNIFSVGIVLGACGINVGHELGHRNNPTEQFLAKLLLLPSHYMHFFIEHNWGHHKNIATDLDPASARKGENLYSFWIRSIRDSYLDAWRIERKRLKQLKKPFWSLQNQMLIFTGVQITYVILIAWLAANVWAWLAVMLAGVVGVLLLETINYIEHYGLRRKKLPSGRYERVQPRHSWNANYHVGRILLYELTRHSDHHFIASKKYQILDHHDQAPELPYGYPSSMLMALVPPLWFRVMDRRIPKW